MARGRAEGKELQMKQMLFNLDKYHRTVSCQILVQDLPQWPDEIFKRTRQKMQRSASEEPFHPGRQ
jgi:hypothetical protein